MVEQIFSRTKPFYEAFTENTRIEVFEGNCRMSSNNSVKITGVHSTANRNISINYNIDIKTEEDQYGVYRATVRKDVTEYNLGYILKKKKADSTFFPNYLKTEGEVTFQIQKAYEDMNRKVEVMQHNKLRITGKSEIGFEVQMIVSVTGEIETAYPLYSGV